MSTLKKIASFFDVGLIVRLSAYGEIFDWVLGLDERSINVPPLKEDARLAAAAMNHPSGRIRYVADASSRAGGRMLPGRSDVDSAPPARLIVDTTGQQGYA